MLKVGMSSALQLLVAYARHRSILLRTVLFAIHALIQERCLARDSETALARPVFRARSASTSVLALKHAQHVPISSQTAIMTVESKLVDRCDSLAVLLGLTPALIIFGPPAVRFLINRTIIDI